MQITDNGRVVLLDRSDVRMRSRHHDMDALSLVDFNALTMAMLMVAKEVAMWEAGWMRFFKTACFPDLMKAHPSPVPPRQMFTNTAEYIFAERDHA